MNRSTIIAALVAVGLLAVAIAPAAAQTGTTVIVPAPSASPPTVITPEEDDLQRRYTRRT